jgi:hypothetical protein
MWEVHREGCCHFINPRRLLLRFGLPIAVSTLFLIISCCILSCIFHRLLPFCRSSYISPHFMEPHSLVPRPQESPFVPIMSHINPPHSVPASAFLRVFQVFSFFLFPYQFHVYRPSYLLPQFSPLTFAPSLSYPDIFLSTLLSDTLSPCYLV